MAPLLYLSATICALSALCLAEIVSLRASSNSRVQALVERPKSPTDYRFLPPVAPTTDNSANPGEDLDLLDIVLVASVDGKFHALNRTSGHTVWSMSSFSSSSGSTPSTLGPLVRTTHVESDPDITDDDDESSHQELYIIEPQSGDIYVMATPSSPLQHFPYSMSQLVDMSPFSFSEDEDRRVFVGKKETSLLLIELETGKIKATLNSECPWDPFEDLNENSMDTEVDLDELEGSRPPKPTEVFIGRTDYHISIHTRPLKRNPLTPNPPVQNLSFSTYGPNNQDHAIQATYRRTKDDAYIQSLPTGEIISFKAKADADGTKTGTGTPESQLIWAHTFKDPIVAVFDVLRKYPSPTPHSYSQPFVLLQPRPRLQDVLPTINSEVLTRLPNIDSAYVGLVQETGSLFVMSPERFPLVSFGDMGSRAKSRYIDAPEVDRDLPVDVDAVTRARKQREKESQDGYTGPRSCRNGSSDRRCLTGARKLEASSQDRVRRLLDGPSVSFPPDSQPLDVGGNDSKPYPDDPEPVSNTSILPSWPPWTWGPKPGLDNERLENRGNNTLSAFVVALILGVISLWVAVRQIRGGKNTGAITAERVNGAASSTLVLPDVHVVKNTSIPPDIIVPGTPVDPEPFLTPRASPAPVTPATNGILSHPSTDPSAEDGEESDREGEGDGDAAATPGKRKGRRGKRGKKKKVGIMIPGAEDGEDDKEKVKSGNGNTSEDTQVKDSEPSPSLVIASTPKSAVTTPSLVVSDTVLGFGSHGTVVFQGSLQGRAVAVKRLLQDFVTLASREVSILQESDDHPNVIRYYYQEAHANFLYIALELCPASLADIIECPDKEQWRDIVVTFDPKRALRQIASGLRHLHALKLVHRDIKPQNILVSSAKGGKGGKGASYRMLISDFGLCKKLDVDQTSFLPTAHGALAAGTVGWRAPEILRGEVKLDELVDDHSMSSRGSTASGTPTSANGSGKPTRLTKSVDIFALGCLFYYTLTNGSHPFGDRFEREVNIMKNTVCLDGLQRFGEEGSEAAALIGNMLNPEAYSRPDTTTCLLHPFFWDPGRRLNFLQDASDRFEIMCRDPRDPNLIELETNAFNIVGNDWHFRLDKIFIENLGKFRKYDGRSVQDLLRALRNKKHHYQDLPDNVKRHLGPMPDGYLSYFTRRYPRLFLHVHGVVSSTGLHHESMFRSYFELTE